MFALIVLNRHRYEAVMLITANNYKLTLDIVYVRGKIRILVCGIVSLKGDGTLHGLHLMFISFTDKEPIV